MRKKQKKEDNSGVWGFISLRNEVGNVEMSCLLNEDCKTVNKETVSLKFEDDITVDSTELAFWDSPEFLKTLYFRLQKTIEGNNQLDEEEIKVMEDADINNKELMALFIKSFNLGFF